MADNRAQVFNFIDANITDPLQRQNTAAKLRAVLKYIVQNAANLADDPLGVDPNPAPAGVAWVQAPTVSVAGTTVSVTQAVADFEGVEVTYDAATFEAALAGDGLQRIDAVYGRPDGSWGYKAGDEGATGVTPTIPTGTLIAGYTFFNSTGGTTIEPQPDYVTQTQLSQALLGYFTKEEISLLLPHSLLSHTDVKTGLEPFANEALVWGTDDGVNYSFRLQAPSKEGLTVLEFGGGVFVPGNYTQPRNYVINSGDGTVTLPSAVAKSTGVPFYVFNNGEGTITFSEPVLLGASSESAITQLTAGQRIKVLHNGTDWSGMLLGGGSSETAASIKQKLETLTGEARLDASAIQNLPSEGDASTALLFDFPSGSLNSFTTLISPGKAGTFTSAQTANTASVVYEVNGAAASLPLTLAEGDTLKVTIARTITAASYVRLIQ